MNKNFQLRSVVYSVVVQRTCRYFSQSLWGLSAHTNASAVPFSRFENEQKTDVEKVFVKRRQNVDIARAQLNRPVSYVEKLLYGCLFEPEEHKLSARRPNLCLLPTRISIHDTNAAIAMLEFNTTNLKATASPTTVHIANHDGEELIDFLQSASNKHGMGFWGPDSGQTQEDNIFENYLFPGCVLISTNSHHTTGALGGLALKVGTGDASEIMTGLPMELKRPNIIGVHLTGSLSSNADASGVVDAIVNLISPIKRKGSIIEYFGEGVNTLPVESMAAICNSQPAHGIMASVFPYSKNMENYLTATERLKLLELCNEYSDVLQADEDVVYDTLIEVNLDNVNEESRYSVPAVPDFQKNLNMTADIDFKNLSEKEKQAIEFKIDDNSQILQKHPEYDGWNGRDFNYLALLLKVQGDCSLEQITPTNDWSKHRGHITNLSNSLLSGARNEETGGVNEAISVIDGSVDTVANVANAYKAEEVPWVVIGGDNFGHRASGSADVHESRAAEACMQLRFLGCKAVFAQSYSRVFEQQLKKHGFLPLHFTTPSHYKDVSSADSLTIKVVDIAEGRDMLCTIKRADGVSQLIDVSHTFTTNELNWFKHGGALNYAIKLAETQD